MNMRTKRVATNVTFQVQIFDEIKTGSIEPVKVSMNLSMS